MKDAILKLRAEGKSYREIQNELGCSRGTVSYHCGSGQKDKTFERTRKSRENNEARKVESKTSTFTSKLRVGTSCFSRGSDRSKLSNTPFSYKAVVAKFGENTICYLSGRPINLFHGQYHFDHIVPVSKGGSNELENLGIATKEANMAKSDLTVDDLIELCKDIVIHNGYKIVKE